MRSTIYLSHMLRLLVLIKFRKLRVGRTIRSALTKSKLKSPRIIKRLKRRSKRRLSSGKLKRLRRPRSVESKKRRIKFSKLSRSDAIICS